MRRLAVLAALWCGVSCAQTVLVLPFFNHSKSSNVEWIGESISESVRDALASEGVLVLPREDRLEAYRRLSLRPGAELTHASIFKVGDSLDASFVVYGFYELPESDAARVSPKDSLRITARLIDLKGAHQGAPFIEVGALEDMDTLESHLGWQALTQIRPKTAPAESAFVKARPAVRMDAVESYIRGLLAGAPEQRHRYFTQAARLDEHYSQPCFQLGKIYWERKEYKIAGGWFDRVGPTDPHFMEARFFLGLCRYHGADFAGAEDAFRTVVAAVPLNEVYNNLGAAQSRRNNPSGAAANFRKALEGDDSDPDYHFNLGYNLWRAGQYDAAVASLRDAVARDSNDTEATSFLGRALKREGPRPGDPKTEGRERLKTNYEETAFRQLQAELSRK